MNIAEIAKMAGVSSAAVSRYFNHGYISEQKRESIRKVVEKTGYRPSIQAQTLRTKKTNMIGVIVPKIASGSIGKVVEGILSELNRKGYQMLLAVAQNDPEMELKYLSSFYDNQVDGVILSGTVFTDEHEKMIKNASVPVVVVGQWFPGHCSVFHDDYHATYDLTKTILERGRRKLGYIGALLQDTATGQQRYKGYCDAVCDMGYASLAGNFVTSDFTVSAGYERAGELLGRCGNLDGIVCATDTMAIGAIQYLKNQHINVPGQILVAGHGDSDIARMMDPPLMTVHFSYEKSGVIAVQMWMEQLGHEESVMKEVKLGYHIVA